MSLIREGDFGAEALAHMVEWAWRLALDAHRGQVDKNGQPYITHPLRVAARMRPDDPASHIVALLHDAVEDSHGAVNLKSLVREFPHRVVEALDAISRRPGETYFVYLERCGQNPLARTVKLADLRDNLRDDRRYKGDEGLRERYQRSIRKLRTPTK